MKKTTKKQHCIVYISIPQMSSVISDKLVAVAVLVAHVAGETEVIVIALAALPPDPQQWTGSTTIASD